MVSLISSNAKKGFSERKCIDKEYHIQDISDFAQKYVKIYCNTKRISSLTFCGPYSEPRGVREFRKNYHLCFDRKLGNAVFSVICIPCACVACTTMLDKPCIPDISFEKRTLSTCYKLHLLASPMIIQKLERHLIVTNTNPL